MTPSTNAIKAEIARLEQQLEKHRRALQLLEGRDGGRTRPAAQRGGAAQPSGRPAPRRQKPTAQAGQPSLRVRIQSFLRTRRAQKLTPSEIAQGLSKRGQPVERDNVQRRLSEMVKQGTVVREEGKYRLAS